MLNLVTYCFSLYYVHGQLGKALMSAFSLKEQVKYSNAENEKETKTYHLIPY